MFTFDNEPYNSKQYELLEFLNIIKDINSWDRCPAILDENLDRLIQEVKELKGVKENAVE